MATRTNGRHHPSIGRVLGLAALAGAIGALVRGLYYMVVSVAMGLTPWAVPNLAGSMLTGEVTTAFEPATFLGGLALHMLTGAAWGVVLGLALAYLMPGALRSSGVAALVGLAFGSLTYFWDNLVGPLINPVTPLVHAMVSSGQVFIGHLIFGVVTALALRAWRRRTGLSVTFAPEARVAARK